MESTFRNWLPLFLKTKAIMELVSLRNRALSLIGISLILEAKRKVTKISSKQFSNSRTTSPKRFRCPTRDFNYHAT
jgi:hypothetical protein